MESLFARSSLVYTIIITWFLLLLSSSEAYKTSNNGNITIKWDIIGWLPDGYVASVKINNHQKDRSISHPGWTLGWRWTQNEVIWNIFGADTTEKGDCSSFKQNIPHSCVDNPTVVDLLPGATQKLINCCRGGVLDSESVSAFQIHVGNAGTTVETVMLPEKFVFLAPKQQYVCGPTRNENATVFILQDKIKIKFYMTWSVTCLFYKEE